MSDPVKPVDPAVPPSSLAAGATGATTPSPASEGSQPSAAAAAPRVIRRPAAPAAAAPSAPLDPKKTLPTEERASRVISRLRNELETTRAAKAELDAYRKELAEYAKAQLSGAPESVRKFVERRAKDDPRAALELLRELREDGLVTPPPSAPANTAPKSQTQGVAAAAGSASGDDAHVAEYERLKSAAPILAAQYLARNRDAIQRAKARASKN